MSNLFKKLFNRKVSKANKRFDEALKEINLQTVKTREIKPQVSASLTVTPAKKKPVAKTTAKKVSDSNKAKPVAKKPASTTKKTTPKKK